MPISGDQKCIEGDRYRWASASEIGGQNNGGDNPLPPPPPDDVVPEILEAILDRLDRLVAIKEDDAWGSINQNQSPYTVIAKAFATNTVKEEIVLPILARSMIIISDQTITVNLYDRLRNGPDLTLQKVSGTTDYQLKQLSLWALPKSRAVDKLYVTNTSGSTANVQVIIWG